MQIERKIQITYRWWKDYEETEINPQHIKIMEDHAHERIFGMIKEGYTSGELFCQVGKIAYSGHFELSYV